MEGLAILIWLGLEKTVEVETKDATAAFTREMEVETRMAPVETQELLFFGCELLVSGRVLNLKTCYSTAIQRSYGNDGLEDHG